MVLSVPKQQQHLCMDQMEFFSSAVSAPGTISQAELSAILMAMISLEPNSKCTIWSDPWNIVKMLKALKDHQITAWKLQKVNHRSLMRAIIHVWQHRHPQLQLQWVNGHQNNRTEDQYQSNCRA